MGKEAAWEKKQHGKRSSMRKEATWEKKQRGKRSSVGNEAAWEKKLRGKRKPTRHSNTEIFNFFKELGYLFTVFNT